MIRSLFQSLTALAVLASMATPAAAQDNVLLIIGDDLGVDRIRSYAEAIPNAVPAPTIGIDYVGDHGVRFTRAYAQQVCAPTRAAILTGRQGFRTGIGTGIPWAGCEQSNNGCFQWDKDSVTTLAQALGETHATAAFGKWHLSTMDDGAGWQHPIDVGFDFFSGAPQNLPAAGSLGFYEWLRNQADANGSTQQFQTEYATSVNVDDTLEWIKAQQGNPWFAWVAFNAAHTPLHDPPPELTTIGQGGNGQAMHRAMVQAMDREIIRLVTSMRVATRQRTWVIFVGDNGNPPSTLPLGGSQWPPTGKTKPNPWEGNVRVPLVVLGPTVDEPGREIADPVHVLDLYATICDLAGVPVPATAVDSISFAPRIRHAAAPPRRDVAFGERFRPNGFGPYNRLQWYITDGRWKVGKYSLNGSQSLDPAGLNFYDLDADLEEATDLLNGPLDAEQQAAFDFLMKRRAEITQ